MSTLNLLMYLILDLSRNEQSPDFYYKMAKISIQTVAPFCLFIEFAFINTIPFAYNHFMAILPLLTAYLAINIVATLLSAPVYNFMKWTDLRNWQTYVVPPSLILISGILCIVFRQFSLWKLRLLGYRDMSRTIAANKKIIW